jgi:flagellar biosynthetic protein FliQ
MVQAATSINEATLSFVPKLIVVAVCLALFGTAILMLLVDFTTEIFARIPELTR